MISTADIHWLAGFMDGEACFAFNRNTGRIQIVQKDIWPLEKVQKLVGGKIYRVRNSIKKDNLYWCIAIVGRLAISVMQTVYVLMSPRRQEKIESIIKKWRVVPNRGEANRKKTHCIRGHEFSPENTRPKASGGRECVACQRIHQLAYQVRRKLAA